MWWWDQLVSMDIKQKLFLSPQRKMKQADFSFLKLCTPKSLIKGRREVRDEKNKSRKMGAGCTAMENS